MAPETNALIRTSRFICRNLLIRETRLANARCEVEGLLTLQRLHASSKAISCERLTTRANTAPAPEGSHPAPLSPTAENTDCAGTRAQEAQDPPVPHR